MQGTIGIVVSGGPAPGINAVICAAVIEACNRGFSIVGFQRGFRGLIEDGDASVKSLSIDQVTRIYNTGGSLLGLSRFNPFQTEENTEKFLSLLARHHIDKLIVIGGEGSAWVSHKLSELLPTLRIAHIPKTIDNDIPLPNDLPTFGYETARSVGKEVVDILLTDAKSCERWYLVETMGRQAGFLALGTALSSGATLALIPEEFQGRLYTVEEIAKIIVGSMEMRCAQGKRYGVAMFAEGILDRLSPEGNKILSQCPRDELGRLTYSEVELGDLLLPEIRRLCSEKHLPLTTRTKNLGYELRCAPPIASDIEYGRFLGYGAIRSLLENEGHFLISKNKGNLEAIPLNKFFVGDSLAPRTIN
ncbi:MAG: 6-phosphofructokinase, partial [Bdellovibrionales bacterium]|nr:6-phosphofructokinase [Bdellovibrionales bacterium]